MSKFEVVSEYTPSGDQPQAIAKLAQGIEDGLREQVLLGVTGSGKTYTMAKVIEAVQRPTLVLAHNKSLAAQLCEEFKEFYPTTLCNTLFLTTITTSRRNTFLTRTPLSKKTPLLTRRSTACVWRLPPPCWSGGM